MKVYAVKIMVMNGYVVLGLFVNLSDAQLAMRTYASTRTYALYYVDFDRYVDRYGQIELEIEEMEVK